jgi:hypothetical protein
MMEVGVTTCGGISCAPDVGYPIPAEVIDVTGIAVTGSGSAAGGAA